MPTKLENVFQNCYPEDLLKEIGRSMDKSLLRDAQLGADVGDLACWIGLNENGQCQNIPVYL